jgi:hypothetical protein
MPGGKMKILVRVVIRIAIIALIIICFTSFINTLSNYLGYLSFYAMEGMEYTWRAYIAVLVLWPIVIALLILAWKKTDWLVNVLAGSDAPEEIPFQIPVQKLYNFALKFLGVWVMVNALPEFVRFLVIYINLSVSTGGYDSLMPSETVPNLIGAGVKIIIGIWLVFGSRGISKAIDTVTNLPINKDVE